MGCGIMRITVAGIGYVGLSNAVLLSQHNKVTAFDINTDRVDMINKKISPIVDKDVSEYLANKNLDLCAVIFRRQRLAELNM